MTPTHNTHPIINSLRFLLSIVLVVSSPNTAWCFTHASISIKSVPSNNLIPFVESFAFGCRPNDDWGTARTLLFGGKVFHSTSQRKNNTVFVDNLKKIYSAPALYDLAMGYRNYEREVEFLLDAHQKVSGQQAKSVIEIASGPGRHCMEAIKLNLIDRAIALDLSSEMMQYGMGVAKEELGDKLSKFSFICDDMRTFAMDERCDSAWILAGSLQHMTSNEDVIACLSATHRVLTQQGTLILELPHPSELFNMIESTTNSWDVPLEDDGGNQYGELHVVWGDENDQIDPITQVRQNTVILKLKGVEDSEKQTVQGVVPLKLFTAQEIELFARCTGYEVASMFGALSDEVDINNEDTAYRLVCILRKV